MAIALSYTSLSSYVACPLFFRYKYIDKRKPTIPQNNRFFVEGSVCHEALELAFKHSRPINKEYVDSIFEAVFAKVYADKLRTGVIMLTYGDTKDTIKAKSREVLYQAIKVLKHTGMDEGDFKNEFVFGDYLHPFELEPGLKIQGSVDWMKDTGDHLVVSDFKTSRDFTYVKPLQLVLYSLALEKGLRKPVNEAYFLMVRSGAKFNVPITIESKAIALHLLREVNSNILAGKFEPKPSSKVCNDCVFRNTCPSSYVKTGPKEMTF